MMEFHKIGRHTLSSIVWGKRKGKKKRSTRDKISVGKRSEGQKAHCLKRKRSDSREPCVWASVQGSDKKKKKKNWCPRAWPYEYGRLSKMATRSRWARCISNSRSSTYRRVEQGWRGVHSCAVYGGLLPPRPVAFQLPVGTPRYHRFLVPSPSLP